MNPEQLHLNIRTVETSALSSLAMNIFLLLSMENGITPEQGERDLEDMMFARGFSAAVQYFTQAKGTPKFFEDTFATRIALMLKGMYEMQKVDLLVIKHKDKF